LTDSNPCLAKGAKAEKGQSACEKGIRKGSEPGKVRCRLSFLILRDLRETMDCSNLKFREGD
jgi:hypothetical protein